MQLATTEIDLVDPAGLKVSGGTGAFLALRNDGAQAAEPVPPPVGRIDIVWQSALTELDPDEPGLDALARGVADRGVPAPMSGSNSAKRAGWPSRLAR